MKDIKAIPQNVPVTTTSLATFVSGEKHSSPQKLQCGLSHVFPMNWHTLHYLWEILQGNDFTDLFKEKKRRQKYFWWPKEYSARLWSKCLLTCSQVKCFSCDTAMKKIFVKGHSDWKLCGSNSQGRRYWNNSLSSYYPLQGTEWNIQSEDRFLPLKTTKDTSRIPILRKTAGFHIPIAPVPPVLVLSWRLQDM